MHHNGKSCHDQLYCVVGVLWYTYNLLWPLSKDKKKGISVHWNYVWGVLIKDFYRHLPANPPTCINCGYRIKLHYCVKQYVVHVSENMDGEDRWRRSKRLNNFQYQDKVFYHLYTTANDLIKYRGCVQSSFGFTSEKYNCVDWFFLIPYFTNFW